MKNLKISSCHGNTQKTLEYQVKTLKEAKVAIEVLKLCDPEYITTLLIYDRHAAEWTEWLSDQDETILEYYQRIQEESS